MPFIRIDGFDGLVYTPEFDDPAPRKHDCPDCAACLRCSDDKCSLCVRRSARHGKKSRIICPGCGDGGTREA